MKLITWFLFRYAPTVSIVGIEQAITKELNVRAACGAHGQKSPNQRDPSGDFVTLAFFVSIAALIIYACRTHLY